MWRRTTASRRARRSAELIGTRSHVGAALIVRIHVAEVPGELELHLLLVGPPLVGDADPCVLRHPEALAGHLNPKGAARLQRIGEAAQLRRELRDGVVL